MSTHRVGAYNSAIIWIAQNDDTSWLDDANGSASITLCLVADVFGRSVEEATADLRKRVTRERNAQSMLKQAQDHVRAVLRKTEAA